MGNKTLYSTDNTNLAAHLIAHGVDMPKFDRTNERRIVYVFQLTDEQMKLPADYLAGGQSVSIAFANAKTTLLAMVKNPDSWEHNNG